MRISVPRDIVLAVLSAGFGLGVSHLYYAKSVSDANAEASEQRRINDLILLGIENVGAVRYVRDQGGRVIGVEVQLRASAATESSGSASLSVSPSKSR
jgi:hypothetical protein